MSQIQHMKEWLDEQINSMECQFLVHKDGLGVTDDDAGYYELGMSFIEDNRIDVMCEDMWYFGSLNGEYIKLKEVRSKLDGIDYNLED